MSGSADGQLAEPCQLEEPGVDHLALVERRPAVPDVVRDRRVRVARLRKPDEVAGRMWPGRRHGPVLDLPLPRVRDAEPDRGRRRVAVRACDLRGRDEAGDLGRDRRRREAALLFPALDPERRPARGDEVRGRLDVIRVERCVGEPELVRHQDRVGGLVELRPERVGRDLAVDEAVPRHRAVRQLLALEQEEGRVARGRQVAGCHEARPRLVQVAREHLPVGAEVRVRRVAGRDGLAPRRGEAGDDRAGERLVLGRLDDIGAQVVLGLEPLLVGAREARQPLGARLRQRAVVLAPAVDVGRLRPGEAGGQRALGRVDGLVLGGAEAERENGLAAAARVALELDPRRLDDVAADRLVVRRRQRVGRVELDEPVARRAHEAARGLRERAVERCVDGLRVVAVRRVRRRDRIEGDEHGIARRVVDRGPVGAAVPRAAASVAVHRRVEAHVQPQARDRRPELDVHEHRVAAGVGHVVGLDPVLAVPRSRDHGARHAAGVGMRLHRVGHVPRLQVGERGAVGDDVLERLDVGVVDRRVVDVAEDAVRDRVPDLRGPVAGGAEAVLAREAEVRERARAVRRARGDLGDDREDVRRRVVGERDRRVVDRDGERDVGPARDAALAVVLVPGLVDRHLRLVRALREAPTSRTSRSRCRPDPGARSGGSPDPSRPGSRARTGSFPARRRSRSSCCPWPSGSCGRSRT